MNRGWTYTNTTETAIVGRVFLPVQAFTILTIILKEVKLMNLTYRWYSRRAESLVARFLNFRHYQYKALSR